MQFNDCRHFYFVLDLRMVDCDSQERKYADASAQADWPSVDGVEEKPNGRSLSCSGHPRQKKRHRTAAQHGNTCIKAIVSVQRNTSQLTAAFEQSSSNY